MLNKRKVILYIFLFLAVSSLILFFYYFRIKIGRILSPFLIAGVIAYILSPMVVMLEKRKIPRMVSILLIYFVFSILITTIIIFIIPEVTNNIKDLMNTIPEIATQYQDIINKAMETVQSSRWTGDLKTIIFREMQNGILSLEAYLTGILKKSFFVMFETITWVLDLILAMIIAYYYIKDAEFFKASFLFIIPRKLRTGFLTTSREINAVLSNFIQGQLLTALIVGAMETIGLMVVQVKFPLILGIIGGIANIIPYFGPVIGAIPAIAVAIIESPIKAMWTIIVFVVIQQIDNALISPKIIEGKLGLHPVTTILAVLVGGQFFGIFGMLFAVPVFAILKVISKRIIKAIV